MKKTLLLLVALITATIAFAKTEIDGIYYNLNDETKTAEVTYQYQNSWQGDNYSGITSITIPEKITYNSTEYSVTSIGNYAFRSCSSLTSITIPNSVTSIGEMAFYYCKSLTSITIPNSVTSIGEYAFWRCSSLTSITIPNSVTSIGDYAFSDCSSLTSIEVNANNQNYTSIDGVLYNKDVTTLICCPGGKTSITIPNSVTSIGERAFEYCRSLTSITIEATTPPTLGTSVFENTKLTAIYIPDNTLSAYKEAWGTDYIFVNSENTLTIHVETPGTLADKIIDAGQRPINVTKLTVTGTLNDDDFTCMRETMTSLVDIDLSATTNTTGVDFGSKDNLIKILLPENLTSIGEYAFYFCSSLTSITIPNSVTYIVEYAFYYCSSLTSITIPNSVTYIGGMAFSGCSSLTSITIPNSVTSIGNSAFADCSSLTSITIPNSVTSIGDAEFWGCTSLTSISIPNSVTSIGYAAFADCSALTSITIPNSVTSIGYEAFQNCTSLTSITIPNSVTSIGERAFSNCSSLTSITIGNSVTSIRERAFSNCSSLTSITIGNSVTSIGDYAFSECSSLTSITIGNSVTSIGNYAFSNCTSLTSITIGNSVTSIGDYAFYDCSSLTSISIPNSVTSIGDYAFYDCSSLTSISIGNSVTSIGDYAFSYCYSLTSISIPNNVTSIGDYVFLFCSSLTSIEVDANNPNYASIEGVLYNKDVTTLICCPGGKTSITIPNSVTSIGDGAFYWCSRLTSITIEATTPPTLGTSAFESTNLAAIYIPDNTLSAYKEAWGTDYNFVNNENTLTIHIETPGTLADKIFDAGQRPAFVTKLTVTGTLNDDDFTYMRETMTSLVDVDLSGITNTSGVNFVNKRNLLKILLPENLTSIGNSAFEGCISLTSITIPNSVTSIGDGAFYWCSRLTSISIPNSVTYIGSNAFHDCDALTSITIPNSVTSIGDGAFEYCYALTSITIPNSVTSIGNGAFYYCPSLTSITCLGSTPPSANDLQAQYETCILFVPKGSLNDYQNHAEWGKFLNIQELKSEKYTITTAVNDDAMGSVTEGGEYAYGTEITLTATANSGYRFTQWSDGNTDNPRIVTVTENKTYTAEFEVETFTITTAAAVPSMGGVKVTLTAEPIEGLVFDHWSDGNTENPRTLTLTEDIELYAYFEVAEATNVETSKISSANIYTTNGTLHIEGATDDYHILDAAGRLIYSGNATTLQLPRGIYLITMGGEVEKIIL